jgi:multidrug efflux pump subunit AcrB
LGLGVHLVADQPVVVEHGVSGFTEALFEAVIIVLGISFLSLGLRENRLQALAKESERPRDSGCTVIA